MAPIGLQINGVITVIPGKHIRLVTTPNGKVAQQAASINGAARTIGVYPKRNVVCCGKTLDQADLVGSDQYDHPDHREPQHW